jgi:hypothetical protein
MNMINQAPLNNNDIDNAQWHLDQLINGGLDNNHLNGLQNFINLVAGNGQQNNQINDNIINQTNNLIAQLQNRIGAPFIRRWLIVELEYEIGVRGNALQVPVVWVQNMLPRLVAARMNNNNDDAAFVNNFLNNAQGYNVIELAYVLERLRNMQLIAG